MEGVLFKWTNYYNGWQPRYFVLNETAVLSYYKSSELINEGCKGSCLVTACEVKAHPHDPLRFDLIIPGEQFFCLKAKSQHERQRWLVALGSSKSRGTKPTVTTTIPNNHNSQLVSHLTSIDQELKLKVQELRLYETVLMQRIHAVKSIANDTPIPDVKKFDETTSLLNVTCDAFIQTLDECVKLATHNSTQLPLHLSPTSSINSDSMSTHRKSSRELISDPTTILSKRIVYRTFFSELRPSFSKLSSLSLNEIQSELFLSICEQYLEFIDKFNSTTLTSFRSNANENICKLREKISQNPKKFQTLYSILNDEISNQRTKEQRSIPDALLSLKRSLDFVACFLNEFGQGDQTVEEALNKAYKQALKQFHDWTTRGLFSIAFRSAPSNEDFLRSLAVDSNDARDVLFEQQVSNEMVEHSTHMNPVLRKINDVYIDHQLQ